MRITDNNLFKSVCSPMDYGIRRKTQQRVLKQSGIDVFSIGSLKMLHDLAFAGGHIVFEGALL